MGLPSDFNGLVWHSSPFTFAGFVVSKVILTVERHPSGALPHIGKEGFKVVPAEANLDPFPAVVLPACVGGVGASRHHCFPRLVGGRRLLDAVLRSMSVRPRADVPAQPKLRASLAFGRVFARERRSAHGDLGTAVATDQPMFVLSDVVSKPENGQASEASARKIDCPHMMIISCEGGGVNG